jgi:hypothetical protein
MSVYSNYLRPYIEAGILQDVDQTKPSEVYAQLSIAYNQGSIGVKHNTRLFVPYYEQNPDDFDDDLYYKVRQNPHLMELISWFNSKFIPEMPSMSYLTIQVRVRIFVSKLNKLVDADLVDKEVAIKVHLNLVDTLKEEYELLVNEELPF